MECDEFAFILRQFLHHQSALAALAMIVCVCHRVSDREIIRHAKAGLSFDDIQFELGVATQCGRCESCARDVVAQCAASHPVAAIRNEAQAVHLVRSLDECKAWNSSARPVPA